MSVLGDGDEAARRPTRAELAMVCDALAASLAALSVTGNSISEVLCRAGEAFVVAFEHG